MKEQGGRDVYPYACGACGGEAVPMSMEEMTAHWRSHVEGDAE